MVDNIFMGVVSIVMPAYNAESTIRDSIDSVFRQSYPHWELIVVDDGSTDNTPGIVFEYLADSRVKILNTTGRCGPAGARNTALKIASGKFVAFLDSDDMWADEKLFRQIMFMNEHDCKFSFTAYRKIDTDGAVGASVISVPPRVSYYDLLKTNTIGCLTVMFDRHHYGDVLMPEMGRREDYRLWLNILKSKSVVHEDYGLWLKMLRKPTQADQAPFAMGLNVPLAFYRCGQASLSSNKLNAALSQWFIYRQVEKLPLLVSVFCFLSYAAHGFVKYRRR